MATAHYDDRYYSERMHIPGAAFAMVAKDRAGKIQRHVLPTDRVLEFGVGSGVALAYLRCADRHGYDINPAATSEASHHGVRVLDTIDGMSAAYDVVVCHHCLEHLTDPAAALAKMRAALRPGGKLLVYVPYDEQRRYRRHISGDPNHHLFSWTPHTLANLVEDCGFVVQSAELGPFGYDRRAATISVRLGLGDLGFRLIRFAAQLIRPEREIRLVAAAR